MAHANITTNIAQQPLTMHSLSHIMIPYNIIDALVIVHDTHMATDKRAIMTTTPTGRVRLETILWRAP